MALVLSAIGDLYQTFRAAVATPFLVLLTGGSADADPTTSPTLSAGSGVPSHAAPDGSGWLRTDATDGDDAFYVRVSGAWVPILGATA